MIIAERRSIIRNNKFGNDFYGATNMTQTIHSVEKAIKILLLFTNEKTSWGITEITQELKMQKSTVFRLVDTMASLGIMRKTNDDQKYRLGLKLFELGGVVFSDFKLKDIAHYYIHALSESCGETVHLGVLSENSVMSIQAVDTKSSLKPAILIGKSSPLYCTGIGKAILAFVNKEVQMELVERIELIKHTENTITDRNNLFRELKHIYEQGYAIDNMENEIGVRCIAAPIYDHSGSVVASLSVSGPSIRITPDKDGNLAKLLLDTCTEISTNLGYKKDN